MSSIKNRKCAKCGATPEQDASFSFHRFPCPGSTNLLRATAWATYCWPDKDWSTIESLIAVYRQCKVLCGRHFEESAFIDSNRKKIRRYSVPGTRESVVKLLDELRKKIPSLVKQGVLFLEKEMSKTSTKTDILATSHLPDQDITMAGTSNEPSGSLAGSSREMNVEFPGSTSGVDASLSGLLSQSSKNLPSSSANTNVKIPAQKSKQKGILQCLNKKRVSELTDNELKMYHICSNKIREIRKLKKKLKMKPKLQKIEDFCDDRNVQSLLDSNISNSFVVLLQSQIKNCRRSLKGRRYNLDQKLLALTLYKKSPACYRLLRRMFALPCQSSLNTLLNRVPLKPGINAHIFESLKKMSEKHTAEENMCTLVFDEMAIRKHLSYNSRQDLIDGFQDHGNHGRTGQIASNALVFMVCGLRRYWKQPVAFYFSSKSTTADRLTVIIKEVLTECFKAGLNVMATVCDLSAVNTKAIHNLGATTEEPFFVHDGNELVTIADPPHLLKCTRNMFMAHDITITTEIQSNGKKSKGTAKWEHLKQFYTEDQKNPNFVYAPALSEKHITPNTKQKMRVKLAAQVFSHTVTAGILTQVATNKLPVEATATATLLQKFDGLFDALNANSPDARRGKKLSTNLTARSPHLKYFKEMKDFIRDMIFVNTKNPPSQSGWIQTINAVERLWANLTTLGVKSCSTRKLNQDPLENFFGCVRYNCGSNCNPTIAQFISGVKTAIITNLRNTGLNKNCENDDGLLQNNLKHFLTLSCQDIATPDDMTINDRISHYETDTPNLDEITSEVQACAYVCGFILKKLKTDCITCRNALYSNPSDPRHMFCLMKEYENSPSLQYASYNLINGVEKAATLSKKYITENFHKLNLKNQAIALLQSECWRSFLFLQNCQEHNEKLIKVILQDVFMITIKRQLILKNRELADEEHKKALERKLKILKHK